jgi:hypothetical protein
MSRLRGLAPEQHPDSAAWPRRRRSLVAGIAVFVVVAAVVLGLVLSGRGDPDGSAAEAGTSTSSAPTTPAGTTAPAAPFGTAAPGAAGGPTDADGLPPRLPAVGLEKTAAVGDGVTARIVDLEAIDAQAQGPGNVAGPALRVTVRLDNGTGSDIDLAGVSVNLAYGPELTPASPVNDPSASSFDGQLPTGRSAEAASVFTVPRDTRDTVTITVGYRPGAPLVVFTGRAP